MEYLQGILGAFIVLAPILIFIIVMLVIRARLRDQSVNLADLLAETEAVIQNQSKKMESADKGEPAPDRPQKRSASRFILFLSSVTILILAVCITTFYFYMNIYSNRCTMDVDLSNFTTVLLALGIGVVPYSVNQIKKIRL